METKEDRTDMKELLSKNTESGIIVLPNSAIRIRKVKLSGIN